MKTYRDVAWEQQHRRDMERLEADYRSGRLPAQPYRITTALDLRSLEGPEVDIACLAEEPAVDDWEAGKSQPTWEQLLALARLTDFPPKFFTMPVAAVDLADAFMCGPRGCTVVSTPAPVAPARSLAPILALRS